MTGNVKVSVVLPTYNVGSFISRCLESLRRQSFYEFEIVVVDDCGSDSSIAIVDKYAEVDKRIRVVRNPRNMGTYHARRVGVEHAVGEFVVFLDPDDELAKDTIGLIFRSFSCSDSSMLFYGVEYVPKRKWYVKKMVAYPTGQDGSLILRLFEDIKKNYALGTPGKAFRRDFLLSLYERMAVDDGFRYVFSEDTCLLMEAVLLNPKFSVLKYDGYIYHTNPSSITAQDPSKMKENMLQYDFMIARFAKAASDLQLSVDENRVVEKLIKKFNSEKQLFLRNTGGAMHYMGAVYRSWASVPTFSKLIRLAVCAGTLGRIRL